MSTCDAPFQSPESDPAIPEASSGRSSGQRQSLELHFCGLQGCRSEVLGGGPGGLCYECYQVSYCCPEHQREDWANHKESCKFHSNIKKKAGVFVAPWANEHIQKPRRTSTDNAHSSSNKKRDELANPLSKDNKEHVSNLGNVQNDDLPMLHNTIWSKDPANPTSLHTFHKEGWSRSFEYGPQVDRTNQITPLLHEIQLHNNSPYEEVVINRGMTESVAGGLIMISCTHVPLRIKARLTPPHHFNRILKEILKKGGVKNLPIFYQIIN